MKKNISPRPYEYIFTAPAAGKWKAYGWNVDDAVSNFIFNHYDNQIYLKNVFQTEYTNDHYDVYIYLDQYSYDWWKVYKVVLK